MYIKNIGKIIIRNAATVRMIIFEENLIMTFFDFTCRKVAKSADEYISSSTRYVGYIMSDHKR